MHRVDLREPCVEPTLVKVGWPLLGELRGRGITVVVATGRSKRQLEHNTQGVAGASGGLVVSGVAVGLRGKGGGCLAEAWWRPAGVRAGVVGRWEAAGVDGGKN